MSIGYSLTGANYSYQGAAISPVNNIDLLKKSFSKVKYNDESTSRRAAYTKALNEADKEFEDLTGSDVDDIVPKDFKGNFSKKREFLDQYIRDRQKAEPDKYAALKTTDQIVQRAVEIAQESAADFSTAMMSRDDLLASVVAFTGQTGAFLTDPVNIAATLAPVGKSVSIMGAFLKEAGINIAAETAIFPSVQKWQNDIGNKYGLNEYVQNAALAGLIGGSFGAAGKALQTPASVVFRELANNESLPKPIREFAKDISFADHFFASRPADLDVSIKTHKENYIKSYEALVSGKTIGDVNIKINDSVEAVNEVGGDIDFVSDIFSDNEEILVALNKPDQSIQKPDGFLTEQPSESISIQRKFDKKQAEIKKLNTDLKKLQTRLEKSQEAGFDVGLKKRPEPRSQEAINDIAALEAKVEKSIDDIKKKADALTVIRDNPDKAGIAADPSFSDFVFKKGAVEPLSDTQINQALDAPSKANQTNAYKAIEESVKFYEQGQWKASQQADFKRQLDEDPDFIVFDEDGNSVKISDIAKEIEARNIELQAITTCGIG